MFNKTSNALNVIECPKFKNLPGIRHGVFTRQGGVSTGIYASLNCSYGSEDDLANVLENRRLAMAHLGYPSCSLLTTKSNHGNEVVLIEKPFPPELRPVGDAMVTKLQDIVLGSDSADCPIVLFFDEKAKIIGLAHAGWKGAHKGILEATIKKMEILGGLVEDITAVISPCILQASYEVGSEVYTIFLNKNMNNRHYFMDSKKPQHFMFDLPAYVRGTLEGMGLKNVFDIPMDTYSSEDLFFSCRRAYHRGEVDFGGHLSFISLSAG